MWTTKSCRASSPFSSRPGTKSKHPDLEGWLLNSFPASFFFFFKHSSASCPGKQPNCCKKCQVLLNILHSRDTEYSKQLGYFQILPCSSLYSRKRGDEWELLQHEGLWAGRLLNPTAFRVSIQPWHNHPSAPTHSTMSPLKTPLFHPKAVFFSPFFFFLFKGASAASWKWECFI